MGTSWRGIGPALVLGFPLLLAGCTDPHAASDKSDDLARASGDAGAPAHDDAAMAALLSGLRARFVRAAAPRADDGAPGPGSRSLLLAGLAEGFDPDGTWLRPRFASAAEPRIARVLLPARSTAPFRVEDVASGASVDVTLQDVRDVGAQSSEGYVIYPGAHSSGATVLHRALPIGNEDFLDFDVRPSVPEVAYRVRLVAGVTGLRLVANSLEMLDAGGAPRLRVSPPTVVASDGVTAEARLTVEGCSVDRDPAAPWGRRVTAPGADTCTVRVTWSDDGLEYPALLDPSWTTTGSMASAREGHTATVLSTGKVLVVGGTDGSTALATAELYDGTTGTWAATASMTGARALHSAVQLNAGANSTTSGKVLIAGGRNGATTQDTAQLYSPSGGTWTAAASLNIPREQETATLLANGRVLVTGGVSGTTALSTAAIYNPNSGAGSWTATRGPMPSALKAHTASLLATRNWQLNDKVIVTGGNGGSGTLAVVYLFDPAASAFSTLAPLPGPREGQTATTLSNGEVLLAGGRNGATTLATAVQFDPSTGPGNWSSAGTMTSARQAHSATLLPNGQVLVAGGSTGSTTSSSAELFSGASTWTATTSMPAAVRGQTASLLANGVVLIAGGVSGSTAVSAARLYDVTAGASCATNSQCATGFCVGGVCCNTACTDQCSSCSLSGLIGTCSPQADGTTCSDGNACTQSDACQAGLCTVNPVACTPPADPCRPRGEPL